MKLFPVMVFLSLLISWSSVCVTIECSLYSDPIFSLDTYELTATLQWEERHHQLDCAMDDGLWLCESEWPAKYRYLVEVTHTNPPQATVQIIEGLRAKARFELSCIRNP